MANIHSWALESLDPRWVERIGDLAIKSTMKQDSVASFFVLACAISWIFWVPAVLYIKLALPEGEIPEWLMMPMLLGTWGPVFAALIMTGIFWGKPGVKKLLGKFLVWRVGFRWWLVTLLFVPAVLLVAMGIYILQGGALGRFDAGQWYAVQLSPVFVLIFGPLGEELGWHGYALSRLQRKYSALWCSVIVGVLWTCWHAPAFWAPEGTAISGQPVTLLAVGRYLIFVIGMSILHTLVYNNTKRSVTAGGLAPRNAHRTHFASTFPGYLNNCIEPGRKAGGHSSMGNGRSGYRSVRC